MAFGVRGRALEPFTDRHRPNRRGPFRCTIISSAAVEVVFLATYTCFFFCCIYYIHTHVHKYINICIHTYSYHIKLIFLDAPAGLAAPAPSMWSAWDLSYFGLSWKMLGSLRCFRCRRVSFAEASATPRCSRNRRTTIHQNVWTRASTVSGVCEANTPVP